MQLNQKNVDNIYMIISKNIKKYRLRKGITQKELAKMSGYSYSYIRKIEAPNCYKNYSVEVIYHLALILGIDIEYLFNDKDI